jgi:hypothetical protein
LCWRGSTGEEFGDDAANGVGVEAGDVGGVERPFGVLIPADRKRDHCHWNCAIGEDGCKLPVASLLTMMRAI